jgi:CRISPR-associated endonuclease/helicase Cas3
MGLVQYLQEVNVYLKNVDKKYQERPFILKVANLIDQDPNSNYLISAPTGYGKTALTFSHSLYQLRHGFKLLAVYPLRTLIENQLGKLSSFLGSYNLEGSVSARFMGNPSSPYLIHPITLTTLDTLSLTCLGISPEDMGNVFRDTSDSGVNSSLGHYMFSWASVYTSSMILDEVHLLYDSAKSLSFLWFLLEISRNFGNRVTLMSATIPSTFSKLLTSNTNFKMKYVEFKPEDDQQFYNSRKQKDYEIETLPLKDDKKFEVIMSKLRESNFHKALIIFNTVSEAVQFYNMLGGRNKVLIHSRFTSEDRKAKSQLVEKISEEKSEDKWVIVGTQAVEAGLDMSSDLLITDLAPANSLVQRFGRFLRGGEEKGRAVVWYDEDLIQDKSKYKVYDWDLSKATLDFLERNWKLNLHVDHQAMLDSVYAREPEVDYGLVRKAVAVVTDIVSPTTDAAKILIQLNGSLVRDGEIFIAKVEDNEVPVGYSYLKKNCVKVIQSDGNEGCPSSERQAVMMSLRGAKFVVKGQYDKERGLV